MNTGNLDTSKAAFLSGTVMLFKPIFALEYGLNDALVYCQLAYRGESSTLMHGHHNVVRFSYTKIQKQLPFFSRRTIISIVSRLKAKDAIKIHPTKRVNEIVIYDKLIDASLNTEFSETNLANMLLYPELANKIGVKEAIVLQQIHMRHHKENGDFWVIKPYHKWQSDVLMFMSLGVVKRVFAKLKDMKLIYVKPYSSDYGVTNAYRVNYLKVAEILQLEILEPKAGKTKHWINPIFPKLKNIK
jgi:hypothetical protein